MWACVEFWWATGSQSPGGKAFQIRMWKVPLGLFLGDQNGVFAVMWESVWNLKLIIFGLISKACIVFLSFSFKKKYMFTQICPECLPWSLTLLEEDKHTVSFLPAPLLWLGFQRQPFVCEALLYQRTSWMGSTSSMPQLLLLQITYITLGLESMCSGFLNDRKCKLTKRRRKKATSSPAT